MDHLPYMKTALARLLWYLERHERDSAILKWQTVGGSPYFNYLLILIRIEYRRYMWHKVRWQKLEVKK